MSFSASSFLALALALVADAHPAAHSKPCNQPYDIPLIRNKDYGWFANISIGTPPQPMTVFTDWTWTSQYAISTTCDGVEGNTADCLSPAQQLFNQSNSATYKDETSLYPSESWFPNEFFPAPFNVDYASDVQTIGPVTSRIVLQTSNIQPGIFTQFTLPFGGIYGMMPDPKGENASDLSPFNQQYKDGAWPEPYAAFSFCPGPSCPEGADAIQTLGGYSKALARKGLHWYDVVDVPAVNELAFTFSPKIYSYWSIQVSGLFIGSERQALNTTAAKQGDGVPAAIFDHASKGRGIPLSTDAYARLVQITRAKPVPAGSPILSAPPNNGPQPFFTVDCRKTRFFPPITYTFSGDRTRWTVEPSEYIAKVGDACVIDARTLGKGSYLLGNFGDNFLKGKYVVFDFKKNRVGLAKV
ncbi:aspartic peptidase domain-containing protein [Amylocarpus encephaloides]|uniref:Aspartic peptidase domain-containing protein n=1 Tax=Amylocarpus encephaloides TaxID=45428 RepID=A0A9P8C990_9HELO|nr:aspartic peptidase domain-containing protein [Amylocarpus encephaloides]